MKIFMSPAHINVMFANISEDFKVRISGGECGLLEYTNFVCRYRKFFINFANFGDIDRLGLVFEYLDFIFICEKYEPDILCLNYIRLPKIYFKKDFLKVCKNKSVSDLLLSVKAVRMTYSAVFLNCIKTIKLKSWLFCVTPNSLTLTLVIVKEKYSKYFFDILKLQLGEVVLSVEGYDLNYSLNSTFTANLLEKYDSEREVFYSCTLFKVH